MRHGCLQRGAKGLGSACSDDQKNMITIQLKTEGNRTGIVIVKVSKSSAANSSN